MINESYEYAACMGHGAAPSRLEAVAVQAKEGARILVQLAN